MNNFFNPFVNDSNGGGGGGGGIDTSDATALAKDIKQGATAYARGIKLTGSMPTTQGGTITPSTTKQTINGNAYLEGNIEVAGDADLIANNIKKNVNIFGVTGTYEGDLDTSDATATAADIRRNKTAYVDGAKITGTIPDISGRTITPNTNQQTISGNGYLNGNIVVQGDTDLVAGNIKKDINIFGVTGTFEGLDTSDATASAADIKQGETAYVNGEKIIGTAPIISGRNVLPGTNEQTIDGDGYLNGNIVIAGDADLIAGNIRKDVEIFGVTGTLDPTSGYDTSDATATANDIISGETAYVNGGKVTGTYVPLDTSDADAQSSNILNGKSAYVNGSKITGNIPSKAAATYTPSTTDQQITSGQYLSGNQTIKGDANLISNNIKGGVTIFGVSGNGNVMDTTEPASTTASSSNVQTGMSAYVNGVKIVGAADPLVQSGDNVTYTPTTTDQVIQGPRILQGNKTMTIKGDADLIPANIRKDVEIFGVVGTLETSGSGYDTSDATATAADIMSGETAYINGGKVTGTYVPLDTSDADATSSDMKAGVTAYVNGEKITGDAYTRTEQINAFESGLIDGRAHWLKAGFYNGIVFEAMPTLKAENIKNGVTIYGVTGTYSPSIITNVLLDTESATSAADIVSTYSSDIEVSFDGSFGTWEALNEYNYDSHPIGAYYSSSYKGIYYSHSNRQNSAILFAEPIDMAAHSIIKYKYYVSTWINPTAQLYLISATSLSDAKQKLADNDIAYSIALPCANTANNSYVLTEEEGVVPGSYYICYCQPNGTGGNEAVLTDLSIIQL